MCRSTRLASGTGHRKGVGGSNSPLRHNCDHATQRGRRASSVHPAREAASDAAMAAGGRMHGLALARAIDWSEHRLVCDVGGGDGSDGRVVIVPLVPQAPRCCSALGSTSSGATFGTRVRAPRSTTCAGAGRTCSWQHGAGSDGRSWSRSRASRRSRGRLPAHRMW